MVFYGMDTPEMCPPSREDLFPGPTQVSPQTASRSVQFKVALTTTRDQILDLDHKLDGKNQLSDSRTFNAL